MATDNTPINEDDDLFNFDEMMAPRGAKLAPPMATAPVTPAVAAAAKPGAEVAIVTSTTDGPSVTPQAPSTVHVEPLNVAPAPISAPGQIGKLRSVVHGAHDAASSTSDAAFAGAPLGRRRVSAFTVAALLVATLLNLTLVGVVWRSMSGVGDALREVGEHVAHANDMAGAQTPIGPGTGHGDPNLSPAADEGEVALATASDEIRQGEFEQARARLYSLLSVIDRFDAKSRTDLASRAQVLVADAFREQADAIERDARTIAAPGFLEVPKEQKR